MTRWKLAAKLLVSAALLGFLVHRADTHTVMHGLASLSAPALFAVVSLTILAVVVSSWRFRRVLRHLGEEIAFLPLLGDVLVGTAYNLLLPTTIGGDVVRGFRTADRARDAAGVWAAVAFERVLGLVALALLGLAGMLVLARTLPVELTASIAIAIILFTAAARALPRLPRWGARLAARLSPRISSRLSAFTASLAGPLASTPARLETLLWSLLYQLISLSILAVALAEPTSTLLLGIYVGVPLALIGAMLPITLGGVGLRESLFVVVLEPFGCSAEQALTLALIWLGSTLMAGAAGALVLAVDRRTPLVT
jgi:glycosyltransferase 2 family protein